MSRFIFNINFIVISIMLIAIFTAITRLEDGYFTFIVIGISGAWIAMDINEYIENRRYKKDV